MKYRKITIDLELGDRIKHLEIDNEIELKEYYKMKNKIDELQQENVKLKEENKRIFSKVNDDELLISNAMYYAEAQHYKSRCEKALHLIKHNDIYDYSVFEEKLENILNGSDENENNM